MFNSIVLWFQNEIFAGTLKPGDKLRSRRFYEIKFGVTKKTIEKVLLTLKNFNFIYSIEKKGYFVSNVKEQSIFKSEKSLLKGASVEVVKKNIDHIFDFDEAKKTLKNNCLNKKNYYSYLKIYKIGDEIIKVSCTFNNKMIKWDKDLIQNSFFLVLSDQNIFPTKRTEIIKGGIAYPYAINKILGQYCQNGVVIFVALFDKKNKLIHITKQFIRQDYIDWQYVFKI